MTSLIENWPELARAERPGRYLGGELGAKPNQTADSQGRLLRVALAFPDVYEIAHGHLGHKILYHMINSTPGLSAERVYAPWPDWEAILRQKGRYLESLESRRPLAEFDIVGFSLQYELGYSNIINMLDLAGLPLLAAERSDKAPLVVAGGPGAYNPEPLADFFDIFFLGDAEKSFVEDLEIINHWKAEGAPKSELWSRLAGRPGIYIPSLFKPVYGPDNRFKSMEFLSSQETVIRALAPSLDMAPFPPCQIIPLIKPVHDRVMVEIGRGCSRGCRFCQAGYVYRPVRERKQSTIMDQVRNNLDYSGQDEVSFLSLSAGDHTQIEPLVSAFMDEYAAQTVALSLPSLRVKSLSGHLARQIKRVRKTGFTLAPEAGTQRLRDVINKDLTDDDLFTAAEEAFSLGWRTLKLYFMVGLPTETDEDLEGIAKLVQRLKKMGRNQLNIGVAHFTPKAHTPFQWHPASSMRTIEERLLKVRDLCRYPGLTPKWNAPGASWVESILARGDRRLGPVLKRVQEAGARFEAWGDRFDPQLWQEALAAEKLEPEELLNPFNTGDPLPYAHLFAGVNQDFLLSELEKSKHGNTTPDCRFASCLKCGACHSGVSIDLAELPPAPGLALTAPAEQADENSEMVEIPPKPAKTANSGVAYLINFKKTGRTAFLGHLELVELFKRTFRRASIELIQSQGFHPQPKISFLTALPLGITSDDEYVKVECRHHLPASELTRLLTTYLPSEIIIKGGHHLPPGHSKVRPKATIWQVESDSPLFSVGPPLHPEAIVRYTSRNARRANQDKEYNLKDFVWLAQAEPTKVEITIEMGLNGTPKPIDSVLALWGLKLEDGSFTLKKVKTILA